MILRILFLILFFISTSNNIMAAELKDVDARDDKTMLVKITAFNNFPISQIMPQKFATVFDPLLELIEKKHNIKFVQDTTPESVKTKLVKTRTGKAHLIVGVYQLTKEHEGLDIIYPAILNNPMIFITLNNSNIKIQNPDDLKNLRFGFNSEEIITDFVKQQIKNLNAKEYTSDEDLYKDLFEKNIDIIISSHYKALVTTAKMGLRKKVTFSNKQVWSMPLFFGISKAFPQRKFLREILTQESSAPENKNLVEQNMQKIIREFEIQHQGAVPPSYFVD